MYSDKGYRALTTAAGFVVRRDRGVLHVAGADRAAWLQGLLTNDVEAMQVGEARYAAYLTPQGRMISDMRVIALAGRMLLDVPAELATALRDRMDGLIFAEDVQVTDISATTDVIEVHGPASDSAVAHVRGAEALGHPNAAAAPGTPPGHPNTAGIVRDDQFGVTGWAIYAPREQSASVVSAFANARVIEVSIDTLEVIRIEAGIPRFLADMTEETIPLEAGLEDRAISFTKGCYVGQEIIVRVMHRGGGRVARRLVGLAFGGTDAASPGDRIATGARALGQITSAAWSPTLGHAIALGYVHRDFVEPGTRVEVATGDTAIAATVAPLPFVTRPVGT